VIYPNDINVLNLQELAERYRHRRLRANGKAERWMNAQFSEHWA
jgi:hypothetical protein